MAAVNLSFTLISSLPAGFLPPRLLSNLARLASWRSTSAARSARTSASRAPITSRIRSNLRGTKVPPPRSPVMYPPSEGSRSRYVLNSVFSAPSAMSSVGSGGRKSFPTSMHSSTKSSTILSQSYSNGRASLTTRNSWSRYSLSNPTCSKRNPSSVGFCSTSRLGWPRSPPPNLTTSRSRQKCGSWVTSASMMRSASRPYRQWVWFGSHPGSPLAQRMCSMILCSPSPLTSWPERMTVAFCHSGSSVCFFWT